MIYTADRRCSRDTALRAAWLLTVSFLCVACAGATTIVESWSQDTTGAAPSGWKLLSQPHSSSAVGVAKDGQRHALHLVALNDRILLAKDVNVTMSLARTPVLEWSWKVIELPKAADVRRESVDDAAVQLYVTWSRFPEAVRSQTIAYTWDSTAPIGTVVRKGTVTYFVVRSGPNEPQRWVTERRNMVEDFGNVYGSIPNRVNVLTIGTSSDRTKSRAECYIGQIAFR